MVNIFLMLQSILGHSFALYVVFDMFFKGFQRKFTSRFPNFNYFVGLVSFNTASYTCSFLKFAEKGFRIFWVLVTYIMAISIPRVTSNLRNVLDYFNFSWKCLFPWLVSQAGLYVHSSFLLFFK